MFTLYRIYLLRRHPENFPEWGFCSHIRTVIRGDFCRCRSEAASCRSPKWRVIHRVSVPWYYTEYLFLLAHCTKRYPIYYERVSYPPMILFSSRPFFSFQIQENNVYKRRYNILFLALFLSQCFKETFNRIRPCLSNVTCNPYWQVAYSCARSWNSWAVILSHYWSK